MFGLGLQELVVLLGLVIVVGVAIVVIKGAILVVKSASDANKTSEDIDIHSMMSSLTEHERLLFLTEYNNTKKSYPTAILLAFFLGGVGAHHFYMRRIGLGILYSLFCWTFVPLIIALIECFFMKRRVVNFNIEQARLIQTKLRALRSDLSTPINPKQTTSVSVAE